MGLPDPFSIADIHPEAEIYQSRDHRKQQKARQPGVQKALPQRLHLSKKRKGDHHGCDNRRHRLNKTLPVIQYQTDQSVVRSRIPDGMEHGVCLRLFQMRIIHGKQPLIQKSVLLLIDEIMLLIVDFRQNGAEAVTERFQPKRRQRQLQEPRKRGARIHRVQQKSKEHRGDKRPDAVQKGQAHRAEHHLPVSRSAIIPNQRKLIQHLPFSHRFMPPLMHNTGSAFRTASHSFRLHASALHGCPLPRYGHFPEAQSGRRTEWMRACEKYKRPSHFPSLR